MHQIAPQETFPIVYVLGDPNDTGTYFVRSVLRNSATGAIIKINNANFVNLTDQGSRRFTKNIQAPNDPSGLGLYVDLTTTVYTDAAYTVKSAVYEEQVEKFLVQTRWNMGLGVGGGGFSKPEKEFDFKKLKDMVQEAINELPTTELPQFDYNPITSRLDRAMKLIEALEMPQQIPLDLSPHTKAIIKEIQKQKTDLTPVLEKIDGLEFPAIPQAPDHTGTFNKIISLLEELKVPREKYSSFIDDIAESVVTRKNKITNEPNPQRLQKLMR